MSDESMAVRWFAAVEERSHQTSNYFESCEAYAFQSIAGTVPSD